LKKNINRNLKYKEQVIQKNVKFIFEKQILLYDGNEIYLTEKEAELINTLIKSNGALSKTEILNNVWNYGEGIATNTLETHIYRLRKKLHGVNLIVTNKNGYTIDKQVFLKNS